MTVNQVEQGKYLSFLQEQLAQLKQENFLLKRAIQQSIPFLEIKVPPEISLDVPEERSQSWAEKDKQFAGIRSQLFETAKRLFQVYNGPVHQDKIIETWRNTPKYHDAAIKVNIETPGRRLRELAEDGWLIRVKEGNYWLGPRAFEKSS